MRLALAAALICLIVAGSLGTATAGKKKPVRSTVTIELSAERARGAVKAKGRGVPARVRRKCRSGRQVIVFEKAEAQDLLVGRDLTNKKGRWSAAPTAGDYLSVPHHAIVVAKTVRDRKSGKKFRCKGATSATVSPAAAG